MLAPEDLMVILAISEEGSVTGAAERLGTSQPAVSRTLTALEKRLGIRLFERLPRGMMPTEAGSALAAHGRAIQAVTQRAKRQLAARIAGQVSELVVGIVQQISVVPIARALTAVQALERPVRVDARVGGASQLVALLRTGELDVVIGPAPIDEEDLAVTPLFDDRPVLVARADHPLVRQGRVNDIDRLSTYPWVMPPTADHASKRLRALFQDAELEPPRPAIVTRDAPIAAMIAATSDFITVLPRDVAAFAVGFGGLSVLPVELPGPPTMIGALLRRDIPHGREVEHFVDALRRELLAVGISPRVPPVPAS